MEQPEGENPKTTLTAGARTLLNLLLAWLGALATLLCQWMRSTPTHGSLFPFISIGRGPAAAALVGSILVILCRCTLSLWLSRCLCIALGSACSCLAFSVVS